MPFLDDFDRIAVEENAEYFVFVRCGVFEALCLSEYLGLKKGLFGSIAKIAFPVVSVGKYIGMLKRIGYSFKLYDYADYGEVIVENIGSKKYVVKYEYNGNEIPVSKIHFGGEYNGKK
ncbi:MAG: hypothetical protein PHP54_01765 [Clostridia bacterium]|nr:hypothetical protein [Clostridia bacterium]